MKVEIEENKLIIVGELMKSTEAESRVLVPGKKHVFFLSSDVQYWSGDQGVSKERFLEQSKKGIGTNNPWLIIDMKDGEVITAGFAS